MSRDRSRSRDRPVPSGPAGPDAYVYSREDVEEILRWLHDAVRELESCRHDLRESLNQRNSLRRQQLVDSVVDRLENVLQGDIRDFVVTLR